MWLETCAGLIDINIPLKPLFSNKLMEIIYFTVTAILLYLLSDWILQQLELRAGHRFAQRSLIFFVILTVLALSSFTLLQRVMLT